MESAIHNLDVAKDCKQSLFMEFKFDFRDFVSPYFCDLIPLLENWCQIFRKAEFEGLKVDIDSCIDVLNNGLNHLPPQDADNYTRNKVTKALVELLPQQSQWLHEGSGYSEIL